jgi:hypothetical protein
MFLAARVEVLNCTWAFHHTTEVYGVIACPYILLIPKYTREFKSVRRVPSSSVNSIS